MASSSEGQLDRVKANLKALLGPEADDSDVQSFMSAAKSRGHKLLLLQHPRRGVPLILEQTASSLSALCIHQP